MGDQEIVIKFSTGNRKVSFSKVFRQGLRPSQHHSERVLWVYSWG